MDQAKQKALAAAMWDTMTELKREQDELFNKAYDIGGLLAKLFDAWDSLHFGPYPDPGITEDKIGPIEVEEDAGMTERILAILKARPGAYLAPTEVRDYLVKTGFSLEGRSNPMAEIHTVLKRLTQKRKRITATEISGTVCYSYDDGVPPKPGAR